jgi:predicted phage terminase large subunit-like protein
MSLTRSEYDLILRTDFVSFIERSYYEINPQGHFLLAPHIEVMAAKLEGCRLGKNTRLIINLPPRGLKSHCCTIAFVAWWLGHNPAGHVICASYGQELADKHARDCRTLMLSPWYQRLLPTRLVHGRQAVHDFTTKQQGTRLATSVGGVLTGRGADLIIIDDPLKPDDALSETRRKTVIQWYDNSLVSRLNDKANGCIIIVMQRLHQDDLVGHVLDLEPWEIVSFPAIADRDETHVIESVFGRRVFRRRAGDALHAERESLQTLAAIRKSMTEYNFAAQYQQCPIPLEGAIVKWAWLKYYEPNELPDRFTSTLQSWDTANKATDLSDFSVCTTWGVRDGSFYLLDVFRRRLNYPELKQAVRDLAQRYRPTSILIEDKASGTPLIQDLKSDGILNVKPYEPPAATDKVMRLHLQTALFENGKVLLPRQAIWLADYLTELTGFPGTKFDDQVDSTTQALQFLKEGAHYAEMWARMARVRFDWSYVSPFSTTVFRGP